MAKVELRNGALPFLILALLPLHLSYTGLGNPFGRRDFFLCCARLTSRHDPGVAMSADCCAIDVYAGCQALQKADAAEIRPTRHIRISVLCGQPPHFALAAFYIWQPACGLKLPRISACEIVERIDFLPWRCIVWPEPVSNVLLRVAGPEPSSKRQKN